jgi:hypothetical protein
MGAQGHCLEKSASDNYRERTAPTQRVIAIIQKAIYQRVITTDASLKQ